MEKQEIPSCNFGDVHIEVLVIISSYFGGLRAFTQIEDQSIWGRSTSYLTWEH